MTAALVLSGILRIRSERKSGLPKQPAAVRIGFLITTALEVAGIVVAVFALSHWHMQQYIVAAIAVVVGLHFLPLAKIFRTPLYYATGLAMVAAAVAGAVILKDTQQIVCICYSMGAILLLTAFVGAVRLA